MTDAGELELLRDSARGALSKYPDALGLAQGGDLASAAAADVMGIAASQGWTAMLLPESLGGLGLGMEAAAIVAEEAGRSLAPGPLLANVLLLPVIAAAHAVGHAVGHAAGRAMSADASWLMDLAAGVAAGEASVAVGVADEDHGPRARVFVEGAAPDATVLRLAIMRGGNGRTLALERLAHPDLAPRDAFDPASPLAELDGSAQVVGRVELDPDATADVLGAAQLWIAADLLGAATRAGEMSVAYAGARKQFGTPIGAYQAIKHRIVDDYVQRQNAAAMIADAARALDARRADRELLVHAARAVATSAAIASTSHCIQVHGAIGFSAESTIHLAYKRARRLACTLGDEARSRAVIAAHLVAGAAA